MAKKKETWFIAVHKETGQILGNANEGWSKDEYTVLPSTYQFDAVLKFKKFEIWGRQTKLAKFVDLTTGHSFHMHLKNFEPIISETTMSQGVLAGRWGFTSHYNTIGIVPIQIIAHQQQ